MGISNYDTTAANNTSTPPNGAPEGMAPSTVNNIQRQRMADIREQFNAADWIEYKDGTPLLSTAIVYVANNQFKITGADATAWWHVGRRVKIVDVAPLTTYATITATSYGAGATTVTIDSTALTNVVLTAYGSIISSDNSPLPADQTIDTLTIGTSILIGGTGAANTFDDYEEGTWTPTIVPASGTGITYTTNRGRYTKIGDRVFVEGYIVLSSKGTSSGNIDWAGLPFTWNASLPNYPPLASESVAGMSITAGQNVSVSIIAATTGRLQLYDATTGATRLQAAEILDSFELRFSGSYQTLL